MIKSGSRFGRKVRSIRTREAPVGAPETGSNPPGGPLTSSMDPMKLKRNWESLELFEVSGLLALPQMNAVLSGRAPDSRVRFHEATVCLEIDFSRFDPARKIADCAKDLVPLLKASLQNDTHFVAFVLRGKIERI